MEQEKKYSPHDCPCRHCNEHRAGCHTIQCPHGWYQWNEAMVKRRDEINKKKHGISFEEAQTVFYDEYAVLFDDPDHSDDEDRFLLIGMSRNTRILIVSHCYRGEDEVIRIISARKATKTETDYYVQGGGEL